MVLRKLLSESKNRNNHLTRRDRTASEQIQRLKSDRDLRINLETLHGEYRRQTDARLQFYIREPARLLGYNLHISEEWRELDRQLNWVETWERELKQTWETYIDNCDHIGKAYNATLWKNGRQYRTQINL